MQQERLTVQEAEIPNGSLSKENTDFLITEQVLYCEQNLNHREEQDMFFAKINSKIFSVLSV